MSEPAAGRAAAARAVVWGPAATLAWGTLLAVIVFGVQVAVAIAVASLAPGLVARGSALDGEMLAIPTLVSAVVGVPAIVAVAALRRGATPLRYLGLERPRSRSLVGWTAAAGLLAVAYDLLARELGRPLVPPIMLSAWRTADWLAVLVVAVVVAAPLVEETLFRGFLYAGLAASRLGPTFAIAVPAVLWTMLHLQYDAFDLAFVLLLGLVLGLARWRSGSLVPCLVAHAAINLGALVEMAIVAPR